MYSFYIVWVIYGGGRKNNLPEPRVAGEQIRGCNEIQTSRGRDMKQECLRFSWIDLGKGSRGRDEEKQHYTTHKASYKHKRSLRGSTK